MLRADGLATAGTTVGLELNATFVSMIEVAYPLFVVLFSFLFFLTVPKLWFFAGGALIMTGTLLITSQGIGHG